MKTVLKEVSDVLLINTSTLAISFSSVEMGLKLILLTLSIVYTLMRIFKDKGNV
tara:strand:+ start:469 stop:630 length:162 start_codon:yes stop_codon:yes gene_type:complete